MNQSRHPVGTWSLAGAVFFACAGTSVHADTISLISSADTELVHSAPNVANYGDNDYIHVGIDGTGNPKAIRRPLFRFDLSSLPANSEISQATLSIRQTVVTDGNSDGKMMVGVHRLLKDWGEGGTNAGYPARGATWNSNFYESGGTQNSSWEVAGADGDTDRVAQATDVVNAVSNIAYKYWDITSDVQKMVSGEVANYGWMLIAPTAVEDGDRFRFWTREATNPGIVLEITYTIPEPATAALGLAGAALVLGRRRSGDRV